MMGNCGWTKTASVSSCRDGVKWCVCGRQFAMREAATGNALLPTDYSVSDSKPSKYELVKQS